MCDLENSTLIYAFVNYSLLPQDFGCLALLFKT